MNGHSTHSEHRERKGVNQALDSIFEACDVWEFVQRHVRSKMKGVGRSVVWAITGGLYEGTSAYAYHDLRYDGVYDKKSPMGPMVTFV